MAQEKENMESGAALFASVEMSTLKAVVEAYARGEIKLEINTRGAGNDELRYAPSFIRGKKSDKDLFPYTLRSVGRFLGWTVLEKKGNVEREARKVRVALRGLELIEEGVLTLDTFTGLTITQAEAVVEETVRVRRHGDMRAAVQATAWITTRTSAPPK